MTEHYLHNGTFGGACALRPCEVMGEAGAGALQVIPAGFTLAIVVPAERVFHKDDPRLIWPHAESRKFQNLPALPVGKRHPEETDEPAEPDTYIYGEL